MCDSFIDEEGTLLPGGRVDDVCGILNVTS